jgi:hypothetical protein
MDLEQHTRAIRWEDERDDRRSDFWERRRADRDQQRGYRIPPGPIRW